MKKKLFQAVIVFIACISSYGYMTMDGKIVKFFLLVAVSMLTAALALSLATTK